MNSVNYIGYKPNTIGDLKFVPIITGDPISSAIATAAATTVASIIDSINKGKPNPNDWIGWNELDNKKGFPIGTNAVSWILNDGQSIQNEALNILQYIQNYGYNNVLTYNSYYQKTITANDLANKLRRGGYVNEANQLLQPPTSVQSVTNVLSNNKNLLLYGGIALAILLLIKK